MNTTENNRLLAEFMKLDTAFNDRFSINPMTRYGCWELMKYDTNWNWLMKVVEKIESLGFTFTIRLKWVKISKTHNSDEVILIRWEEDETKIEAVYNACLEFIEWYNENVKSAGKK